MNKAKAINIPLKKEVILERLQRINQGAKFTWEMSESITNEKPETKLKAYYKLKNYPLTWLFLGDVAKRAHAAKHHPTITNTYNQVHLELTTHDQGNQVTLKDIDLATSIQDLYNVHFIKPVKIDNFKSFLGDISGQSSLSNASRIIENLISVEEGSEHKHPKKKE